MDTIARVHIHLLSPRAAYTSGSPENQFNLKNVQIGVVRAMSVLNPSLRRVFAEIIVLKNKRIQFQHPRLFLFTDRRSPKFMATKDDLLDQSKTKEKEHEKREDGETVNKSSPPPPPEKPEPGDCCGSGCVRCVWDVYYEELEEYDKLYHPDSKNSTS